MALWDRYIIDSLPRHFRGVEGRGTVDWLAAAPEDDKRAVKALIVKAGPWVREDLPRHQAIALGKINYFDDEAGEARWIATPLADPGHDYKLDRPVHNYIDTVMSVFKIENSR
jgi:hypothetical protein